MTLEQFRQVLEEAAQSVNEALEARTQIAQAKQDVLHAQNELASCKRQCELMVNDAKACEQSASKVKANAEAFAKELEAKAQEKVRRILEEGNKELKKVQMRVAALREESDAIQAALVQAKAELQTVHRNLEKARGNVKELLGAAH